MDALTEDRGQALLVAVLAIGIGATAIIGLRAAQERVLASAAERRGGEAAAAAAAAAIADEYVAHLADAAPRGVAPDVPALLADPRVLEGARAAAADVALRNGVTFGGTLAARCAGAAVEVELVLARHRQRAAFRADACSPR